MIITRQCIQEEYINLLYENNKKIFFIAPTGFGKDVFFSKCILDDLLKNKKSCLIISTMSIINDEINNYIFDHIIDTDLIENRSKKEIFFKNGSSIIFMLANDLNNANSILIYDIVYITTMDFRLQSLSVIYNSLPHIKKFIITDSIISNSGEIFYKQLKIDGIKIEFKEIKRGDDILMELRKLKLKKIISKCSI